jgi:hypothetical protein
MCPKIDVMKRVKKLRIWEQSKQGLSPQLKQTQADELVASNVA